MRSNKLIQSASVGILVLMIVLSIAFFMLRRRGRADIAAGQAHASLDVKSPDFTEGGSIPAQFTCTGANLSPALEIGLPPTGTRSFAIVMDDPDSPFGFVHWLVYNIPSQVREIGEGASSQKQLPTGTVEGVSGADTKGYTGPCPPGNKPHHYVIRVYALDTDLNFSPGITKQQLASGVTGHVLAEGQLTGFYGGDQN
jgi:Raf kinase inhibitor-like YbhB/YbcL family protein